MNEAERKRIWWRRRIASGLCGRCGKNRHMGNRTHCKDCAREKAIYMSKRYIPGQLKLNFGD